MGQSKFCHNLECRKIPKNLQILANTSTFNFNPKPSEMTEIAIQGVKSTCVIFKNFDIAHDFNWTFCMIYFESVM